MKYLVMTDDAGMFEFALGQLAATKKSLAMRDANGTARAFKGTQIIALMREGFAAEYRATLEELEQLRNRNGH